MTLPKSEGAGHSESFKISKLMQPFQLTENTGLFLVNFERTFENIIFAQGFWPEPVAPSSPVVPRTW